MPRRAWPRFGLSSGGTLDDRPAIYCRYSAFLKIPRPGEGPIRTGERCPQRCSRSYDVLESWFLAYGNRPQSSAFPNHYSKVIHSIQFDADSPACIRTGLRSMGCRPASGPSVRQSTSMVSRTVVHRLIYNRHVAAGQLAVFQGGPSRTGNRSAHIWIHTGRGPSRTGGSNAEKQPTDRGPKGCVENGPAAALLVGYVPIQICALLIQICALLMCQSGSDRLAGGPF
jgi:hypothetical protein